MDIKEIKPEEELPKEESTSEEESTNEFQYARKTSVLAQTKEFLRRAFVLDSNGSRSTTNTTYTSYDTTATSQFIDCPAQAVASPMKLIFRVENYSSIVCDASFIIEHDGNPEGDSASAALFLDGTQIGSPLTVTYTEGGVSLHFAEKILPSSQHEIELKFHSSSGSVTATLSSVRITLRGQRLIKL